MVDTQNNKNEIFKEVRGGPPPVDESWWETVLAEEEGNKGASSNRFTFPIPVEMEEPPALDPSENAMEDIDWQYAKGVFQDDQAIELRVSGFNRGGLLVSGAKLRGFVPVSHLVDVPSDLTIAEQDQFLEPYIEHLITVKIIECDSQRGRVVFSERAALAEPGKRNALLNQLRAGECVTGTVTNVTEFGVFIDLGGVEGLLHVSEISWGRVRHPAEMIKVGDRLQVYVISVDPLRSRIALSLKRMCQNPWEMAEERYYPGLVTEATITSIVPFGAFARLEDGLDGLIHISAMGTAAESGNPLSALHEGQNVLVRVLHVDGAKQRLGLSLDIDPKS